MHRSHGIQHLRHKWPTFAFTSESGYTLAFRRRIAHSGLHAETGAFPPSSTAGLCAACEIALSAAFVTLIPQRFYIHTFPGSLWPPLSATALPQTIFHRVFQLLPQMAHVRFHERKWVHTRLSEKDRTQRLTRRNRGLPDGAAITTLGAFHTVRKPCVARGQNGVLCRFWALAEGAPEERRKPSEQRCAYARRCSEGVAAPLGCVICLQLGDVAVFSLCAQYFLNVRGGGGITTLGAFHTVRKPCVAGV